MWELENWKISPSASVVKWRYKNNWVYASFKHEHPNARDYYMKMIYDKLRNKDKFLTYTKLPTKKRQRKEEFQLNLKTGRLPSEYKYF